MNALRPSQTTAPPLPMIVTAHPRAWMGTLQQTGQRAAVAPSILSLSLLVLVFVIALLLAVGASAWFTRRLETISDLFDLSAGLLSLLGALGANIPNYVASLAAAASGQFMVGLGIILGSNIYNIAIILGISTFASKAQHGIALTGTAAKEVRVVATSTLAIMLTTLLAVGLLAWRDGDATLPLSLPVSVALLATNLLSLGLFCVLAFHALQRVPHEHRAREAPTGLITEADPLPSGKRRMAATRALGKCPDAEFVAVGVGELGPFQAEHDMGLCAGKSNFKPALSFAHGLVVYLFKAEFVPIKIEGFVLIADAYSDGTDFCEHVYLLISYLPLAAAEKREPCGDTAHPASGLCPPDSVLLYPFDSPYFVDS